MQKPYWIPYQSRSYNFPPINHALEHPDGLLAVGGDLSMERLLVAYRQGIFPWYSDDQPILWWSPSQRMVLFPEYLKVSRSLRQTIRRNKFTVTMDTCFRAVMKKCAEHTDKRPSTWITKDMLEAYCHLHENGFAHSVEIWYEEQLVGGLYGLALGKVFFGESMFSRVTDASKVALVRLVRQLEHWGYELIDCEVYNNHLASLGAMEIPRRDFRILLDRLCEMPGHSGPWQFEDEIYE
jgi:leucyl/phenylalanyl-tRNA--protein transferase